MPQVMSVIIVGAIIIGAGILVAAMFPLRTLINQLPRGVMRRNWYILKGLIFFFIIGYLCYAMVLMWHKIGLADIVVSVIFLSGACFVWLVNVLSLKTALDIRRISMLEHENITDALIDIYNRRYFDRRVKEEFGRAQRYGLPLSILMLDIDHFKRVNDTYGHQTGDAVLVNLGKLLVDTVRNTDIVARYGGEEICIIATNTKEPSAAELAELLRERISAAALVPADEKKRHPAIHITVSIGVFALSNDITSAEELLENADSALYRAKSLGRNRVATGGIPLLTGSVAEELQVSQFL